MPRRHSQSVRRWRLIHVRRCQHVHERSGLLETVESSESRRSGRPLCRVGSSEVESERASLALPACASCEGSLRTVLCLASISPRRELYSTRRGEGRSGRLGQGKRDTMRAARCSLLIGYEDCRLRRLPGYVPSAHHPSVLLGRLGTGGWIWKTESSRVLSRTAGMTASS
jgi:hypothetical protein